MKTRTRADDAAQSKKITSHIAILPQVICFEIGQFADPISLHHLINVNLQFAQATNHARFWYDYYNHYFQVPDPVEFEQCLTGMLNYKQMFTNRFRLCYELNYMPLLKQAYASVPVNGVQPDNATFVMLNKIDDIALRVRYQLLIWKHLYPQCQGTGLDWKRFAISKHNFLLQQVIQTSGCKFVAQVYDTNVLQHTFNVISNRNGLKIQIDNHDARNFEIETLHEFAGSLAAIWNVPPSVSLIQFLYFLCGILEPMQVLEFDLNDIADEYFKNNAHMQMDLAKYEYTLQRIQENHGYDAELIHAIDKEWQQQHQGKPTQ